MMWAWQSQAPAGREKRGARGFGSGPRQGVVMARSYVARLTAATGASLETAEGDLKGLRLRAR